MCVCVSVFTHAKLQCARIVYYISLQCASPTYSLTLCSALVLVMTRNAYSKLSAIGHWGGRFILEPETMCCR